MTHAASVEVAIRRLPHAEDLPVPAYATAGSAGLDLPAALDAPLELAPGARALVPTGFAIALPPGYEAQVRPRSGLAVRHGVTILDAPGTVDSDYRGEIKALLVNLGDGPVRFRRGDRIAQLVIAPVAPVRLQLCPVLDETQRGRGGFGSTGLEKIARS